MLNDGHGFLIPRSRPSGPHPLEPSPSLKIASAGRSPWWSVAGRVGGFAAASLTSCAPCSHTGRSVRSPRHGPPSLVLVGLPQPLSMTALRPVPRCSDGGRVYTPLASFWRASCRRPSSSPRWVLLRSAAPDTRMTGVLTRSEGFLPFSEERQDPSVHGVPGSEFRALICNCYTRTPNFSLMVRAMGYGS